MDNYKVYKHMFPNGKVYIGITSLSVCGRWHNGQGYNNQYVMKRAIQKYGWENIKHEILFDNLTKEEAEQKEIELIAFYMSNQREFGYNIESGGNSIGKINDKTKEKLRIINLNKKLSDQTKQKISKILKGKPKSLTHRENISKAKKGVKLSDETKQKIRNANLGRKWTNEHRAKVSITPSPLRGISRPPEVRQKISQSSKGKVISQQTREKLRIKNGGCNNPMFNKKHTPEALAKIIASIKRKPVICVETNIKYNSIMDCSKMTGISETAISRNCKGLRKQAKGFHFKFI